MPVIVGVGMGAVRTNEAVALSRDAETAGADGLLLAPMSYAPLPEAEVRAHVLAVAGATGLPLCLYNNPATTRLAFSEDLIAALAQAPSVTAVKMPLPADGDVAGELGRLRARTPDGYAVGLSGDWGAAEALLAVGDVWFSVAVGLLPDSALRRAPARRATGPDLRARLHTAQDRIAALPPSPGAGLREAP